MTLFEWARARWTTAPAPQRRTSVVPAKPAASRVAARYSGLYTYLERRYASTVVLTFEQMESLLGFSLPAPAWTEREWWTSPTDDTDRHSDAWSAARRTATPNLVARNVAFERLP